jgi:hypothetical protein
VPARPALDAGTRPAGAILGPLGMRRADRRAEAASEMPGTAVLASAVLILQGMPTGIAEERVTSEFCRAIGTTALAGAGRRDV